MFGKVPHHLLLTDPIRYGDPLGESEDGLHQGSFTRFVMPFGYRAQQLQKPSEAPRGFHFAPATRDDWLFTADAPPNKSSGFRAGRRKYWTPETSECLYDQAKWLVLKEGDETTARNDSAFERDYYVTTNRRSKADSKDKTEKEADGFWVRVRRPAMVLFEFPDSEELRRRRDDGGRHPLQSGLLIWEIYLVGENGTDGNEEETKRKAHLPIVNDLLLLNETFRFYAPSHSGHWKNTYQKAYGEWPVDFLDPDGRKIKDLKDNEREAGYAEKWRKVLHLPGFNLTGEDGSLWNIVPKDADWEVYADNRAFVWTCAIRTSGQQTLEGANIAEGLTRDPYRNAGVWLRLLNVDEPGGGEAITAFERDWVRDRTYLRWAHYGTLYGFCYHSGAMLSNSQGKHPIPTWRHFGAMYFDQMILLFYIRITLFRFSLELNRLSRQLRGEPLSRRQRITVDGAAEVRYFLDQFQLLRLRFDLFTNLYQFPLLSNQQQGLELYELARKAMDSDDLFREVEKEIQSTHQFLEIFEQSESNSALMVLTVLGSIGLLFSVAVGLFGMNILIETGVNEVTRGSLGVEILVFAFVFVVILSGAALVLGRAQCLLDLAKKIVEGEYGHRIFGGGCREKRRADQQRRS